MTRLSCRQFPMLRVFANASDTYTMSLEEARRFDQRPFRSMLIQQWIGYRPGKGFFLTKKGAAAWEEFRNTDIQRKNPALPLTSYFDLSSYGLRHKPKVDVITRGAA